MKPYVREFPSNAILVGGGSIAEPQPVSTALNDMMKRRRFMGKHLPWQPDSGLPKEFASVRGHGNPPIYCAWLFRPAMLATRSQDATSRRYRVGILASNVSSWTRGCHCWTASIRQRDYAQGPTYFSPPAGPQNTAHVTRSRVNDSKW